MRLASRFFRRLSRNQKSRIFHLIIIWAMSASSSACTSEPSGKAQNRQLFQLSDVEIRKRFSGHFIPGERKKGQPFQQRIFYPDGRFELQIEEPYFGTTIGTYSANKGRLCITQRRQPECFRVFTNHNKLTFLQPEWNENSQPYPVILQKF